MQKLTTMRVAVLLTALLALHAEAGPTTYIPLSTVRWDLIAQALGDTLSDSGSHAITDPWYGKGMYLTVEFRLEDGTLIAIGQARADFSVSNLSRSYFCQAHLQFPNEDYASAAIDVRSETFDNMTGISISFDYDFFHSEPGWPLGGQVTCYVDDVTDTARTVLCDIFGETEPVWAGHAHGNRVYSLALDPDHAYYYGFEISIDNPYWWMQHTNRWASIWNVQATVIPAPSVAVLGSIGVGLVSWLRRRRTL